MPNLKLLAILKQSMPRLLILLCGVATVAQMQSIGDKETFAAAKLFSSEAQQIIAGVEQTAYDTPDSWEKELRVRRVDLGSGPGIVVRGTKLLCGGTGNCQLWAFRMVNGKWVSLFDVAAVADRFQLGPATTNSIKDLTTSANLSAESGKRVTYKFDGNFYRSK